MDLDSGGDSQISQADSVFGDLDCNDNTPVLKPQVEAKNNQHNEEMTPAVTAPLRTSGHPSNVSTTLSDYSTTNHPLSGLAYSPEDTINNDFFYDDEFSVPFDANLADHDAEIGVDVDTLDTVDINTLLTQYHVADDNQQFRHRMSSSKSDSCLYQIDLDLSNSDRGDTSAEQSMSDRDFISSSELSDLRSEPLFSPLPGSNWGECRPHILSTDSLGPDDGLCNSFMNGDGKYTYDWCANKDHYMLSFDRSPPSRASDEESSSYHDSMPSDARESLNSWAQRSGYSLSSSTGSFRMTGSGRFSNSPIGGSPRHMLAKRNVPLTTWATKNSAPVTTWAQMKEGKEVGKLEKGMTTWKSLREAQHQASTESAGIRSKSLPDLKSKQMKDSIESVASSVDTQTESRPTENGNGSPIGRDPEEAYSKRYSTSLFELFQRLKAQYPDQQLDFHEGMVSPDTLNMLTGTWSMSPCSEKSMWTNSQIQISGSGMISWSSMKHSNGNVKSTDSLCSGSEAGNSEMSASDGAVTLNKSVETSQKLTKSFSCNTSLKELLNASAQAGSGILTKSIVCGKPNRDVGVQFPPLYRDCSVQTSFEDWTMNKHHPMNRSLQTSGYHGLKLGNMQTWKDLAKPRKKALPPVPPPKPPRLEKHTRSPEEKAASKNKENEAGKDKMNNSGFYTNDMLPDLSFLNNAMTMSATLAELLGEHSDPPKSDPIFISPVKQKAECSIPPPKEHERLSSLDRKSKSDKRRGSHSCSPRGSRESSPVVMGTRVRQRSHDSSSTNSFCSSSSSGIDPGSYESQSNKTAQYFSNPNSFRPRSLDSDSITSESEADTIKACDLEDKNLRRSQKGQKPKIVHSNPKTTEGFNSPRKTADIPVDSIQRTKGKSVPNFEEHDGDEKRMEVKPDVGIPRTVSAVCSVCNSRAASVSKQVTSEEPLENNTMVLSHPAYFRPRHVSKGDMKKVEYLQVSPTHKPSKAFGSVPCGGLKSMPTHQDLAKMMNTDRHAGSRGQGSTEHQKKPLKSCLVKRRKGNRKNLFKHRSYSDPNDLAVMKHSQEGQTRYQLITPPNEQECPHGLQVFDVQITTSLPAEVLHKAIGQQMSKATGHGAGGEPIPVTTITRVKKAAPTVVPIVQPATPPNSPEMIPVIPCPCQAAYVKTVVPHAVDPTTESDMDSIQRAKKSVSFSAEVFYHSPYSSPHHSPKKPVRPFVAASSVPPAQMLPCVHSGAATTTTSPVKPVSGGMGQLDNESPLEVDVASEAPPVDFMVSPVGSMTSSGSNNTMVDIQQKREMVMEVIRGAEMILTYFSKTRDPAEKMILGSSAQCLEVGHMVLKHLCPAVYALLLDGLKPQVRSLFGKMKNNVWRVIEDSAELGPSTRIIHELVQDLKNLSFLSTTWLKFNAFIFGLMNHKALDFWLTYIHNHEGLLTRHYSAESFLQLSTSATRHLFLDMTTALQPLAQLPFRLEYDFEFRSLQEQQQRHLAEYLLDKHVAGSAESHLEGQQVLAQQENMQKASRSLQDTLGSPNDNFVPSLDQMIPKVSKQTKDLIQAGSKKLLGKLQGHSSMLSFDSLNTVLSMGGLRLKGPLNTRSRSVPSVPQLAGINDDFVSPNRPLFSTISEGHASSSAETASAEIVQSGDMSRFASTEKPRMLMRKSYSQQDCTKQGVSIVKNNEVLVGEMDESNALPPTGFLDKVARQIKDLTSPEKIPVYKKGITEYQFDAEVENGTSALKGNARGSFDDLVTGDQQPQSQTDSGIDIYKPEGTPPVEFTIPTRHNLVRADPKKRWSASDATRRVTKPESGGRDQRKRWSTFGFGSSLIQVFDRLLLDGNKESSMRDSGIHNGITQVAADGNCGGTSPLVVKQRSNSVGEGRTMNTSRKSLCHQVSEQADKGANILPPEGSHPVVCRVKKSESQGLEVQKQVQALCHHIASADDQLSFEKGDILHVLREVSADWLLCYHGNSRGMVHTACVKEISGAQALEHLHSDFSQKNTDDLS